MGMTPKASDIWNIVVTPTPLALETLSSMLPFRQLIRGLIPTALCLAVLALALHRFGFEGGISLPTLSAAILFVILYLYRYYGVVSLDTIMASIKVLYEFFKETRYYRYSRVSRSTMPALPARPLAELVNVLLIIDESIRADYLSINNPGVDTTPFLKSFFDSFPNNAFNYGVAIAAGGSSFLSQITILTGPDDLPDRKLDTLRRPTIFQVAKAAGYRTMMLALQDDFPNVAFGRSDMAYVDEFMHQGHDLAPLPMNVDLAAAAFVRKRLASERGLFIVLLKTGAHIRYETRYPRDGEHCIFSPRLAPREALSLGRRREIVNSYKNALRYNLDGFFRALFEDGLIPNTTVVYTSDHGQSFQEDGQIESHGSKYLEQALVPLLVFSSDSWVLENLKRPCRYTLSHMNIYPTISCLLRREPEQKETRGAHQSIVTHDEIEPQRLRYIYGGLWDGTPVEPPMKDGRVVLREERYMY
jgi:glucan phosphoethanolaminetransferase (alkaline phosphatase superfamily)